MEKNASTSQTRNIWQHMGIAGAALAEQVGELGVFSDWPATVTYYANCMKLK